MGLETVHVPVAEPLDAVFVFGDAVGARRQVGDRVGVGGEDGERLGNALEDVVAGVSDRPVAEFVLAENEYGIQGFRHGNVYGLQSHPEYDPRTAEAVTRGKDLPEERIESVCAGITESAYDEAKAAKQVFDNFCRLAGRRAEPADD